MRIRILRPTAIRLELAPGDELHLTKSSGVVEQLLASRLNDGELVAQVLDGDEDVADLDHVEEQAVAVRRRGQQRSSSVP